MAIENVNLPDIGEGVTEGEMIKWLVSVGDSVEADQPVAEVMTDKATVEVPSPIAGTVTELVVNEGDIVPIETVMLKVDSSASAATSSAPAENQEPAPVAASTTTEAPVAAHLHEAVAASSTSIEPPVADSKVLATPSTRRLARELNVDINNVNGTGLAGRVTREDVLSLNKGAGAVAAGAPMMKLPELKPLASSASGGEERVPLRGIRRKIAQQMQMTKQVVPHFTLMDEANVTELYKTRAKVKAIGQQYGVKVTYLPFIMKALIATMREFPMFNASIDDAAEEIVYKKYFNIGFAADTPQGLMVPVIKNADQKTILQLSQEITDLSTRARDGKLALDEMKGACVTITNIGSVGGTYATPIINHPEVAILGMYKMVDKPVYMDGKFKAAKVMNYTVTCDHRLIDGAVAANFLNAFFKRIENPSHLLLDMI